MVLYTPAFFIAGIDHIGIILVGGEGGHCVAFKFLSDGDAFPGQRDGGGRGEQVLLSLVAVAGGAIVGAGVSVGRMTGVGAGWVVKALKFWEQVDAQPNQEQGSQCSPQARIVVPASAGELDDARQQLCGVFVIHVCFQDLAEQVAGAVVILCLEGGLGFCDKEIQGSGWFPFFAPRLSLRNASGVVSAVRSNPMFHEGICFAKIRPRSDIICPPV